MKEKTLLVTGGCGFIGSNFIRYWMEKYPDDILINLDKLTYAGNPDNLADIQLKNNYNFKQGDICDKSFILSIFEVNDPDIIVHFAAESHVDRSITGPDAFINTNVTGTFTLLECARLKWTDHDAKRFIHISTDEVYGSLGPYDPPFSESTPYAPNSPYSASKAASDHLVRSYFHTYGLPVITSNCSNNYGPYQFPEKLIPLMITNALKNKPLPVYGDGKNIRDWLHVKDHCRGIEKIIDNGKTGETYNIGGCNEWANIDIVNLICSHLDQLMPSEKSKQGLITFVEDRLGHDKRYAINANKIQNDLGWSPEYTFETGIRETIQWYIDNQEWVNRIEDGSYRSGIRQ